MNTYDPADYIVYVSMDRTYSPSTASLAAGVVAAHRLPNGYANGSPRTRLRRPAPTGYATASVARLVAGPA
jgi:hypothetical protein